MNHISGVMICVVGHGFETQSGQTKDYKIGISCFSTALRGKNKDWLAWNQVNVSDWSDMSTHGLLFHWSRTIKILPPVQNSPNHKPRATWLKLSVINYKQVHSTLYKDLHGSVNRHYHFIRKTKRLYFLFILTNTFI